MRALAGAVAAAVGSPESPGGLAVAAGTAGTAGAVDFHGIDSTDSRKLRTRTRNSEV